MSIGDRIKECRKNRNITQKELSDKSGIPIITIQQYERGTRKEPRLANLIKIAAALSTSVNYLISGETLEMGIDTMENKQLIANKICEALQQTQQFAPHRGYNGLLELRYFKNDIGEFLRPVFENDPEGVNEYYDIDVTWDSGTAMFVDVAKQFVKRMM